MTVFFFITHIGLLVPLLLLLLLRVSSAVTIPFLFPFQKETLRARCQTFAFGSTLRRTLAGLPRRTEWLVNVELTLAVPDPTP